MSSETLRPLLDLLLNAVPQAEWDRAARQALNATGEARYGSRAMKRVATRVNPTESAPFAAWIPAGQPSSGAYGGMSFVIFPDFTPSTDTLPRFGLVVGTNGLNPDQDALSRPGHARKVRAVAATVNTEVRANVAWSKRDPTRVDQAIAASDLTWLAQDGELVTTFEKYGSFCYLMVAPRGRDGDVAWLADALAMVLDLFFEERGVEPLAAHVRHRDELRSRWMSRLLPTVDERGVTAHLRSRRFVILQGPPGTGKTRLALRVAEDAYTGRSTVVQFHPATTYESFVGGLAPVQAEGPTGLQFAPRPGVLMQAAAAALDDPRPHLLVIDEINRADLGKVLGEAIHVFEPGESGRTIQLQHDYGQPFGRCLRLPENLHVLGTMNTADRSIAMLDVAVRRRFAFVDVWPRLELAAASVRHTYEELARLFLEYARDREFALLPGHSYFMDGAGEPRQRLRSELRPLLQEYLDQGLAAGFADQLQGFVDRLDAGTNES